MKDEVRAYQWWCGDDLCDCTQYVIEQVREERVPGSSGTRFRFRRLWEGRFQTDSAFIDRAERAADLREYRLAARRFGIALRLARPFTARVGERPATAEERANMAAETAATR